MQKFYTLIKRPDTGEIVKREVSGYEQSFCTIDEDGNEKELKTFVYKTKKGTDGGWYVVDINSGLSLNSIASTKQEAIDRVANVLEKIMPAFDKPEYQDAVAQFNSAPLDITEE